MDGVGFGRPLRGRKAQCRREGRPLRKWLFHHCRLLARGQLDQPSRSCTQRHFPAAPSRVAAGKLFKDIAVKNQVVRRKYFCMLLVSSFFWVGCGVGWGGVGGWRDMFVFGAEGSSTSPPPPESPSITICGWSGGSFFKTWFSINTSFKFGEEPRICPAFPKTGGCAEQGVRNSLAQPGVQGGLWHFHCRRPGRVLAAA